MCRRCGETDKRGSAAQRRKRTQALLDEFGNGIVCPCVWCGDLVGAIAGQLRVDGHLLPVGKLEQDRLDPDGSYFAGNVVPACGPCNRSRPTQTDRPLDPACQFGPWPAQADQVSA